MFATVAYHAGRTPDVLHEELLEHNVPKSLVVDRVHLLCKAVVGDLYDGVFDVFAVIEADLLGVAYDSRVHESQEALSSCLLGDQTAELRRDHPQNRVRTWSESRSKRKMISERRSNETRSELKGLPKNRTAAIIGVCDPLAPISWAIL